MAITLQVSERAARRLMRLCETAVKDIGVRLAADGMRGLATAAAEIREMAELIARLEAAGLQPRQEPPIEERANASAPEAPAPETPPTPEETAAGPDAAPPPAVLAARATPKANGSTPKFVRQGIDDMDASSGP